MGNICSKSSNPSDPFAEPGRVLGAGADTTTPSRAPLPQKRLVAKGGRTLGASGGAGGQNVEARSAAARAAEERAAKQASSSNKGKLSSQLAAQRAKTHNKTLNEISQNERAVRNADAGETARRWE